MSVDDVTKNALNIALLKNVQRFGELDDAVLDKAVQPLQYSHVERGEVLIRAGEAADNLYIVLKGRFVVLAGTPPIAETSMGKPIGELAFFAGGTPAQSALLLREMSCA